jgi:hypothetical protein
MCRYNNIKSLWHFGFSLEFEELDLSLGDWMGWDLIAFPDIPNTEAMNSSWRPQRGAMSLQSAKVSMHFGNALSPCPAAKRRALSTGR